MWLFGSWGQGNKHTFSYYRRTLRVTPRSTFTSLLPLRPLWEVHRSFHGPYFLWPPNESKYPETEKAPKHAMTVPSLSWTLYVSHWEFHGTLFPFRLTGSLDKSVFHTQWEKIKRNVIRSLSWHHGTFSRISPFLGQIVWDRGKIVCVPLQVCLHQCPTLWCLGVLTTLVFRSRAQARILQQKIHFKILLLKKCLLAAHRRHHNFI